MMPPELKVDERKVENINTLTKEERETIRGCISLKMASVLRAAKGESNPAIAKMRQEEYAALESMLIRFR